MTVHLPDELARRVAAEAVRAVTIDEMAALLLSAATQFASGLAQFVVDPALTDDPLGAFTGCGASGRGAPFEIHRDRQDLAARKLALLVDTGVLLSAADSHEPDHASRSEPSRHRGGELVVPDPVVPETASLIKARLWPSAEVRFLRLVTTGELGVVDLDVAHHQRRVTLIERHADLGLGLVAASVAQDHHHRPAKLKCRLAGIERTLQLFRDPDAPPGSPTTIFGTLVMTSAFNHSAGPVNLSCSTVSGAAFAVTNLDANLLVTKVASVG